MSIDVRGAQHYILPQRVIAWKRVSALCGPFKTPMMGKTSWTKRAGRFARIYPAYMLKLRKPQKIVTLINPLKMQKTKSACQELLYEFGDRHISPRNPSPAPLNKEGYNYSDLPRLENSLTYTHQWMKGGEKTLRMRS